MRLGKSYFKFENEEITPLKAIVTNVFLQDVEQRLACFQKPYHSQYNLVTFLVSLDFPCQAQVVSLPLHFLQPFQILTLV